MEMNSNKATMKETMLELMNNEDFKNMWVKMHTPYRNKLRLTGHKIGKNDICPFCTSGKKFKKCTCYTTYKAEPYLTGMEARNIDEQLLQIR